MYKFVRFLKKIKDKVTSFVDNHKLLSVGIIVAIFLIILIVFIIVKANEKKEEPVDDELYTTEYISEVKSPEIEPPKNVEVEDDKNDGYFYNLSQRYKFKIPDGFTVKETGDNIYLRDGNGTQIVVVKTTDTFSDVMYLTDTMMKYAHRMTILVDGEEKKVTNYGAETKETLSVGPYDRVKREIGEIWATSDKMQTSKMPEHAYFTLLPDKTGVILMGTSDKKSSNEVFSIMDGVLTSFEMYEPTEEELNKPLSLKQVPSEKKDKNIIAFPSDWEITKNNDGMIYAKAPASAGSAYTGVVIEYFADENKNYVSDFAQFSGLYEGELMAATFTQAVNPQDFDFEKQIVSMDRNAKIGEKSCFKYDMVTMLYPYTRGIQNSMGPNRDKQISKRYCFESNGVPCVLNFITGENNCDNLINQILEKSVIY